MKIVPPSAYMVHVTSRERGVQLLRECEQCARLSHRSEDKITLESWEPILRAVVLQHGDWSVVEHASVRVFVLCDRGISHEWVRHRLGAYTQESTRFVNYKKKFGEIEFVQPETESLKGAAGLATWEGNCRDAEMRYFLLLDSGVAPQIARSVLPNSLATRLYVTYNLRMWRHFFIMRTTKETHPQMRQLTIPLLREFQSNIPLLYDDIIPEEKQSVSMARAR